MHKHQKAICSDTKNKHIAWQEKTPQPRPTLKIETADGSGHKMDAWPIMVTLNGSKSVFITCEWPEYQRRE